MRGTVVATKNVCKGIHVASFFDGPDKCDDRAFMQIRFRDLVPQDHPVRYIDRFIDGIDIAPFELRYKVGSGKKGRAPKDIHLILKVILYALYCRIYSARKIDYSTEHYGDFWFFTHGQRVSHDKISDFINIHGDEIHPIFLETINLASKNDLLDFSALYEDGFKVKANASNKRCRTLDGLNKEEKKLSENLDAALAKLQLSEDDETAIEDKKKLTNALFKITSLREQLQKRVAERSVNRLPSKVKHIEENSQINLTDSDAEMMKQKDRSNAVSYLKETTVDPKADIVMASAISGHDDEIALSLNVVQQANENCENAGCREKYDTAVADAGFTSFANCEAFENEGITLIGPTQNSEHQKRTPDPNRITMTYNKEENSVCCSMGQVLPYVRSYHSTQHDADINIFKNPRACAMCSRLKDCTDSKNGFRTIKLDARYDLQQKVLQRYLSEEGQKIYSKRSHCAETYQGDLKQNGGFLHFLRRGIKKVGIDSVLLDIVWNLRRIFNAKGTAIVWSE